MTIYCDQSQVQRITINCSTRVTYNQSLSIDHNPLHSATINCHFHSTTAKVNHNWLNYPLKWIHKELNQLKSAAPDSIIPVMTLQRAKPTKANPNWLSHHWNKLPVNLTNLKINQNRFKSPSEFITNMSQINDSPCNRPLKLYQNDLHLVRTGRGASHTSRTP